MAANIRPAGVFDTRYAQDIALNRTRLDRIGSYSAFLLLLLIPLLTTRGFLGLDIIPAYWIGTLNRIAILTIAVQGLNLLTGYTGQISLGHAAFIAVGAYSSAVLGRELAMPFWLAIPFGALIAGGVGLLFGLPSLRVKGFYLAMATLAAQFIIPWVLKNPLAPWTGGSVPLTVPTPFLGPIDLGRDVEIYYIIIPVAVLLMLATRNILRTRTGRAFISIRDNDLAAELLGINVFRYKLQAFFLSAVFAGIAGGLAAYDSNIITIEAYHLDDSIELLAMLVIGGAGFPLGPLFGVAFVSIIREIIIPQVTPWLVATLPQVLPFVDSVSISGAVRPIIFGTAIIVFLLVMPRGLAHRWEILRIAWKIRPFSH